MKKKLNAGGVAMLVDLDACTGCYGCEAACRETHRYGYVQEYFAERNMNLAYYNDQFDLHCGDTVYVDGKLRQYHLVAPVLDKCAACIAEDPNPLCMTGCPAAALIVGQFEDVVKEAAERHCAIFTA